MTWFQIELVAYHAMIFLPCRAEGYVFLHELNRKLLKINSLVYKE
jgi:hypothetical protein